LKNIRYNARARLRVIGLAQRQRKQNPRKLGLSLRQSGRSPRQLRAAAAAAALAGLGAPAEAINAPSPAQTEQTPAAPAQRPGIAQLPAAPEHWPSAYTNNRPAPSQGPAKARRKYEKTYLTSWADRLIYLAWAARNKPPSAPAKPAKPAKPADPLHFPPPPWRPIKNIWKQNRIDSIEQVKKANAEIIAATFKRLENK
jgi:hypothetical protein